MDDFVLRLENFQTYTDSTFTFSTGITVITGPNDSGKSAIFRAIDSLCTNPSYAKDEFIQFGKEFLKVTLSVNNNNFEYIRSLSGSAYNINGEFFGKIGRDDIIDMFPSFPLVRDEQDKNILNIRDENSLMFPFDRKDSELFVLFEDLFGIVDSSAIIKSINSDISSFQKELNSNSDNYIVAKELELKYKSTLDSVNISSTEEAFNKLVELNSKCEALTKTKELISSLKESANSLPVLKPIVYSDGFIDKFFNLREVSMSHHKLRMSLYTLNKTYLEKLEYPDQLVDRYLKLKHLKDFSDSNFAYLNLGLFNKIDLTDFDLNFSKLIELKNIQRKLISLKSNLFSLEDSLSSLKAEIDETLIVFNSIEKCPLCGNTEIIGGLQCK